MSGGTIKANTSTRAGGVMVEDASGVMTGGTISGNAGFTGGGIEVHACTDSDTADFTMKGGEISGNTAESNGGAANVFGTNGNARLTMENGIIKGNKTYFGGGVACSYGVIQIDNGRIIDNTAQDGGGVYIENSEMIMEGGEISGNTAINGGGIMNSYGTLTLTKGNISNNTAQKFGGGVNIFCGYVEEKAVFRMTGGKIDGNRAVDSGSNPWSGGGGVFLQGKKYLFEMTGGSVTENITNGDGGGVCVFTEEGSVILSGSPVIENNKKVSDEKTTNNNFCSGYLHISLIKLSGALSASARIGVTDGYSWSHDYPLVFTSGLGAEGNIGAFFSDDPEYTVERSADSKEACLVKKAEPTAAPTAKPTAAPTAKPTTAPTAKPTAKPTATPKVDISKCKLTVKDQTYTGKALKPAVTVKYGSKTLKQGTDYTVSYKNNVKPGTATVTVTGKGDYTGSAKATFRILVPLSKCKLAVKDQAYTGKALKPAVTVKYGSKALKKGADYTVSYKNNKAVGVATVTVTGKGGYTGTKKLTFNILPRAVTISKLTAGKQSLTVKWGKRAEATGYELQYALKSSFAGAKTVKIKKNATVSATIKKLKTGKTYYVRLRSYKTVGKKTYYSAWSKGKSGKVK